LKNIGTLVSGDIENPILKADAIWIEEGLIKKVGFLKDMDEKAANTVIDCAGTTVTPAFSIPTFTRFSGFHAKAKADRLLRKRSARRRHHFDFSG